MSRRRQRRKGEKEQRHVGVASRSQEPRQRSPLGHEVRVADRVERLTYTRIQAAAALGVSLATLDRRVVPAITTIRTEWGTRLIPVTELERYLAERTQEARAAGRRSARPGRKAGLPPEVVARIRDAHARGGSLGEIARGLNADRVRTSQGGRQWWPSTVRAVLVRSSPADSAYSCAS